MGADMRTGQVHATIHRDQALPLGRQPSLQGITLAVAVLAASIVTRDWIAGVAVCVLSVGWRLLRAEVGPPTLALALSHQWVQVVCGIFYFGLTGRQLPAMYASDYRPMVLIGLGCVSALMVGLYCGKRILRHSRPDAGSPSTLHLDLRSLLVFYVASVAFTGIVQQLAWSLPILTQGILALTFFRLALLLLIFRRLIHPRFRWSWFGMILASEVVFGFTGYFAGFREALIMAALAAIEAFNWRLVRYWVALCALASLTLLTGLVWTSIKEEYRRDLADEQFAESSSARLERVGSLASRWLFNESGNPAADLDAFADRLWAVYYPALAVSRVPAALPHTNGAIMWSAVRHVVTPRFLFPEKAMLPSDSEMVRIYSGVPVAGSESNTSIAFGYAAESYIDFGLPWMFLPVFAYGVLMGMAYQWFLRVIRHRELAVALVSVVFWISLYLFERSWVRTLGMSGTLMIYLGGATLLVDRYLAGSRAARPSTRHGRSERERVPAA